MEGNSSSVSEANTSKASAKSSEVETDKVDSDDDSSQWSNVTSDEENETSVDASLMTSKDEGADDDKSLRIDTSKSKPRLR